ncbi:MAG TPA: nuclear transport factor 2 family protein [Acidobacteriaceae bacterium]|nr:nuclear transport factor 2 family protein [Acidobacteriaceae bacterium]
MRSSLSGPRKLLPKNHVILKDTMTLTFPLSTEQARAFAEEWIAAWNAHDLAAILRHYAPEVVLTSPVAARITGDPAVTGIDALGRYFARGLELFPNACFGLLDVFTGFSTVVLVFTNQNGTRTAEWMQLNGDGKVVCVAAQYSA